LKTKDDIQEKALTAVGNTERCSVGVSMGVGKTLIGLRHMAKNYSDTSRFLVVAPKRSIFQSWKDDAVKFNMEYLLEHIDFTTYLSLTKKDHVYDIIYLDECHSLLYTHEPWLTEYQGKILGLTGTPPRFSQGEKGEMVAKFCPVVYKYVVDSAVDDKILNDYRLFLYGVDLDTKKNIKVEKNGKVWFTSEEASYDYWTTRLEGSRSPKDSHIIRIMRMKSLMDFPSKERYASKIFSSVT
jgi:superfamily II DNA or RNA helicase